MHDAGSGTTTIRRASVRKALEEDRVKETSIVPSVPHFLFEQLCMSHRVTCGSIHQIQLIALFAHVSTFSRRMCASVVVLVTGRASGRTAREAATNRQNVTPLLALFELWCAPRRRTAHRGQTNVS